MEPLTMPLPLAAIFFFVNSDFYIWTFAYDYSGIKSVTFHYRIDKDGENPIHDTSNEIYRSGEWAWY